MTERAPCGSWPSPVTAAALAGGQISIAEPRFDRGELSWLEGRPSERGRVALVSRGRDGAIFDVLPDRFNVRTRVHEMGGAPWIRKQGVAFFSEFRSQRLFRHPPGTEARPITPDPPAPASIRYADPDVTPDGQWLVCVREQHSPRGVTNDIVLLPTDGSREPRPLVAGHDFFSFPRISPDGGSLLWTSWDHPRMPWDGTDLWAAELRPDRTLGPPRHLAGGPAECVFQPEWGPSGRICFISDRTGWGNLYALDLRDGRGPIPLLPIEAEFAAPQWVFGMSRYALLGGERIVAVSTSRGRDRVVLLDTRNGRHREWDVGYTAISAVASDGGDSVALVGASPQAAPELAAGPAGSALRVVRRTFGLPVDPAYLSLPEHVEFASGPDRSAFAFFYPPAHRELEAPEGEKPPLIVTSHGGPTAAANSSLNLATQFWTSRGFGVVDVNYGGSTGYGRAYMESLRGRWGEVDAGDCVSAARHLAARGDADPARMAIRGRSASGLTTLCALVFYDVFRAGASYYGVADLEGLARDTHKFESRYLDGLIGPYPERADLYQARSPLRHAGRLQTPVIFFQGLEDVVVPPSQAEALIRALEEKSLPYAYLTFPGEQHGFRQADSIRRSLEAELGFYARILGFEPADRIEPIEIRNL